MPNLEQESQVPPVELLKSSLARLNEEHNPLASVIEHISGEDAADFDYALNMQGFGLDEFTRLDAESHAAELLQNWIGADENGRKETMKKIVNLLKN